MTQQQLTEKLTEKWKEEIAQWHMTLDIHTHTTFSHGKGSIEDNVKAALKKGLKQIGIADHGPGHVSYGIKRSAVAVMRQEILRLRQVYPQIEILLGVEANVMNPSGHLDVTEEEFPQYDYVLAGYHYGVLGEVPPRACLIHSANFLREHTGLSPKFVRRWNTEMTVKALYENDIRVLTHPGDKGDFDIAEIAKACAARGTWMEISNWHKDLTVESIGIAAKEDVTFIVSSDAHTPQRVGSFEGGLARAMEAGLPLSRIVNIQKRDK